MTARIPESVSATTTDTVDGFLFWMGHPGDDWLDVRSELSEAFEGSRLAAKNEQSIVYIVANDALLGRSGPGAAMASAGLLSAARTAAIEGSRKGWTANVVSYDEDTDHQKVLDTALAIMANGAISGDLTHVGPGHLGKVLP